MALLFDLFNPTFFLFLAIILLVTALLVVYFESKLREQNHKIASMLSLVSSLAEEFNVISHELKQHATKGGAGVPLFYYPSNNLENPLNSTKNNLINVSDDESEYDDREDEEDDEEGDDNEINNDDDDDDETNNDDDDDDETNNDDDDDDETNNDDDESDNIDDDDNNGNNDDHEKHVKINFSKNDDIKILKFDEELTDLNINNLDAIDDIEYNSSEIILTSETVDSFINENITNNNLVNEGGNILLSADVLEINESKPIEIHEINTELKTININLEENGETLDYKKLPINKLRNIVVEKGLLSTDTSKLKKNEILKLLGVE